VVLKASLKKSIIMENESQKNKRGIQKSGLRDLKKGKITAKGVFGPWKEPLKKENPGGKRVQKKRKGRGGGGQ